MRQTRMLAVVLAAASSALAMGCAGDGSRRATEPVAAAVPAGPLAGVAFMAGHWRGAHDGGAWEEHWSSDEGGVMVGTSKMVVGGRCVFFEFSRIAPAKDGTVALLVSPGGRHPPTVFPLESSSNDDGVMTAVFHKPDHDYPRVIRYVRSGHGQRATLEATLEGVEKGVEKREMISMRLMD